MKNFEIASRMKFRFPYKGMISTEDLWDLTMDQLDSIYKTLNADVKKSQEDSLLSSNTEENTELNIKIEIVKYIFNEKKKAVEERQKAMRNAEKRQRILEVLAKKQDESLQNMSEDELLKMLNDIEG